MTYCQHCGLPQVDPHEQLTDSDLIDSGLSPEEIKEYREREAEDMMAPIAVMISDALNGISSQRREALVRLFLRDHPTLVQRKAELFLRFFYELAKVQWYDARDEASVLTAREIVNALGEHGDHLPYI